MGAGTACARGPPLTSRDCVRQDPHSPQETACAPTHLKRLRAPGPPLTSRAGRRFRGSSRCRRKIPQHTGSQAPRRRSCHASTSCTHVADRVENIDEQAARRALESPQSIRKAVLQDTWPTASSVGQFTTLTLITLGFHWRQVWRKFQAVSYHNLTCPTTQLLQRPGLGSRGCQATLEKRTCNPLQKQSVSQRANKMSLLAHSLALESGCTCGKEQVASNHIFTGCL